MASTYRELQRKKAAKIISPDPDLFSDWGEQPTERQPSEQALSPDPFLFSDWGEPLQPSVAAQPGEVAAEPGVQFARQEREPSRVLGYKQRTLAELEQGLAGLRLPATPQNVATLAGLGTMANIPAATLTRMASEAREEGIARELILPEQPGADASLGEKLEYYYDIPSEDEQQFIPGELPHGWEPVLRDVLRNRYCPEDHIEHIVQLTRSGQVPMISTMTHMPDWKSDLSVRDTLSGMKVFAQSLMYLTPQLASSLVKSLQGVKGTGIHNKSRFDKLIQYANDDLDGFARKIEKEYKNKRFAPGIPIKELAQLPRNLSFSLISSGHAVVTGLPLLLAPVPGARVAAVGAGVAASGVAAYKMASYEVMQNYLELSNEDMLRSSNRQITPEEEKQLKSEFMWKARKYGLWEAVPEMLGNVAQVGTVFAKLNRMLGKSMATRILVKMGGVYTEELFTEALTHIKQSGIEAEAGFPGAVALDITDPRDWLTALQEVAPQTALLTLTLGGAGATYVEVRSQLKSEIGEGHDQFKRLLKQLRKRHSDAVVDPGVELTPDINLETGESTMVKMEDVSLALPVKTATQQQINDTTAASDFDAASVAYLMETGMSHEEILASSEVMRDMAFQAGVTGIVEEEGFAPGGVQIRDTGDEESALIMAQRDRMAPVEGDTVLMPYMQQAGTLLRYNNDGTGQVALPSGLKIKVEKPNMIKAKDLQIPLRAVKQRVEAVPVKSDIPQEFSPVAIADGMLRSMPDQDLLNAISMVGEGTTTPLEAIYTLSYGHPQQDLIRSLASEIGEETFVDMMVDAVSRAAADIEIAVEQKRKPVPRQADQASQEFSGKKTVLHPSDNSDLWRPLLDAVEQAEGRETRRVIEMLWAKGIDTVQSHSSGNSISIGIFQDAEFEKQLGATDNPILYESQEVVVESGETVPIEEVLGTSEFIRIDELVIPKSQLSEAMTFINRMRPFGEPVTKTTTREQWEDMLSFWNVLPEEVQPDPTAPPPYTVPLNEYLLTREPPALKTVNNIRRSLPFQAAEPKAINRYIAAVGKLVADYLPEEHGAFLETVEKYEAGEAKLSDIDISYASIVHRRIASIQFADVMDQTGLSDPLDAAMVAHRQSVADALANGQPVSENVLEDYPDLTGQPDPQQEMELPGLDEIRHDNIEAQNRRVHERGGDQPRVGLQIAQVGPGGLPLPGPPSSEFEQAVADLESANPDVARALNAGRTLMNQMKGWKERWAYARKAIGELVNPRLDAQLRKVMAQYVDDKRTGYLTIASRAQVKALTDVGALWGDLNDTERDSLMHLIFVQSLLETRKKGMKIPGDLSLDEVQKDYDETVALLQQSAPEILNIRDRYQAFMRSLAEEMVDRAWLKPDEVMDFYAPHLIIDYVPQYFLDRPYISKQGRKAFQAYLKKREGSIRDIYANQEAIASRISTIYADMMFDDWVTGQLETHDIYDKMTPEAKLAIFPKRLNGRIGEPQPHGKYEVGGRVYRGYQYVPGNMVYRTDVVNSSLLAEAFKDAMEDIALAPTPNDEKMIEDIANRGFDAIEKYLIGIGPRGGNVLRSVRAIGARNKTYLIPELLYNDMKHLTTAAEYNIITEVMHDARRLNSLWKTMTTQISGGLPFHLRNETGDVINVTKTAGWKPLGHVPSALKILRNIDTPENLTEFEQRVLQIVLDKAVLEAGYLTELRARAFQLKGTESNALRKGWNAYQRLSGYRELSNRVALVSYNLQRHENGLPIEARDLKSQIYGLDTESKIAYVARNALVDYGDVPAWHRRHMSGFWLPFATFYQKNMMNWANLVKEGNATRLSYIPPALTSVVAPAIMLWLWNNYGPNRKMEEGLGYRKNKWFHANLWQWDYDDQGNPHKGLVWSPEHPADLALEAVGGDKIVENIDYVRRGILTPKEAAAKQIYDFGFGPLRMGQRLLNPLVGAFVDILANENPYTGVIVPRDEEALPNYDKLRHYWWPHMYSRILTPLGQYMTEAKGDRPPLQITLLEMPAMEGQDPFDVNIRLPRRPFDVLRGLGFYVVDLDKELDRDWWQMRRSVGANRARQMRKFRQAYVNSPDELATFISSDEAMQLMDETWRKDFAVDYGLAELKEGKMPPRGSLIGYLSGPSVQLDKARSKLRDPKLSKEGRARVEMQIRKFKELRRLQDLERIRDEEWPATFKQMLRRIYSKIEKDSGPE